MKEFKFSPENKSILAQLRKMPIFDAMEPEQLAEVVKMGRIRRYDEGEVIIAEGEMDQMVFFLAQGSCTVQVEGLGVGVISKVGDVFGEMGMVDAEPRSATITAREQVICLAMDGSFLDQMKTVDDLASKGLFYRIFSEILAARVRDANARILKLEDELKDLSVQMPSI
ncbi:cyclic nucleotide-binding domain-containing protein [Pseudodesulfovibrio sp. zrk46]|uniref:cyclic nucleotide-binding domain-containing protein n=1 Tax=Pseudodesulfovibrio sp. zrk46 TaxID=2725288 RepID=UPI00144928E1|nr:cyclic nucleotide-binding domain-containing protein [Pseudodesulfovibrio sp. zrk46]QJB55095.1 cyclic nucleotide-binding domain-containing protein [Pseudodesulfovibrio sp. zrk46]